MARWHSKYVVKSYEPLIGFPESRWRVTVVFQPHTLKEALTWTQKYRTRPGRSSRLWIEQRGRPAYR